MKLLYLACDFLGALVYQLTNYVIMIVLFIVPFMFPSKLSSVLFIFTSTSASYYAILKVSVVSKVRNLVKRQCHRGSFLLLLACQLYLPFLPFCFRIHLESQSRMKRCGVK